MPEFMEIVRSRRTVRRFEERTVPEELLNEVLEACRWAQSWANAQPWEIVVVRDPEVREAIKAAVPEGNPSLKSITSAPVLLVLCAKLEGSGYYKGTVMTKFGDWFMFDLGIATENMALAAHALGLGSVCLGLFNQEEVRKVVNAPEKVEAVGLMCLGYPAKVPDAPPRKAVSEFAHDDSF